MSSRGNSRLRPPSTRTYHMDESNSSSRRVLRKQIQKNYLNEINEIKMQTDVLVNQMSKTERIVRSTLSPSKDKSQSQLPIDLENDEERNKLIHRKIRPSYPRHNTSNIPVRKSSNVHSSEKKKRQSRLPVFKASPKYNTAKIPHIINEDDLAEEANYKTENPTIEPLPDEELLIGMQSVLTSSESSPTKVNANSSIKMVDSVDLESEEESKIEQQQIENKISPDFSFKIEPLDDSDININKNICSISDCSGSDEEEEKIMNEECNNIIKEDEGKDINEIDDEAFEAEESHSEKLCDTNCSEEGLPSDIPVDETSEIPNEIIQTPVKEVRFNIESSPLKACDADILESSDSEELEKSVFANNDNSESEEEEIANIKVESIDKPRFVPRRSPVIPVIVSDEDDDEDPDRPLAIYRQLSYSDSDDS